MNLSLHETKRNIVKCSCMSYEHKDVPTGHSDAFKTAQQIFSGTTIWKTGFPTKLTPHCNQFNTSWPFWIICRASLSSSLSLLIFVISICRRSNTLTPCAARKTSQYCPSNGLTRLARTPPSLQVIVAVGIYTLPTTSLEKQSPSANAKERLDLSPIGTETTGT